jgi:hypothetical protein
MFCPKCAQQVLDTLNFCSSCGLALDSIKNLLVDNPSLQANQPQIQQNSLTPYQKGIRHGFQFILLSIILIPAYILLAALFPANDVLVESSPSDTAFEKISQAILGTIFVCGLARMFYAYLFERSRIEEPPGQINADGNKLLFSTSVTCIESEGMKTGELIESTVDRKQTSDQLNGH